MNTIDEMKLETQFPVIITDEQGIISYVNDCFTSVFGWNLDEIMGEHLEIVIPYSFHDAHRLSFSRFIMTGKSKILNHPLLLKAVTKDGLEIESEHTIMAEKQGDNWFFAATIRPL
ncbi:PAS domain-containing protein [Scytonema sp. UIC 10036]|uniref:PAS domain-containing protein n=1 Tax=Scytonema sp. UIC 10036 TaxID=2304196 RepID=UPI0012DA6C58|nr:PAS domain-containing protein [Scytonema sp. UIC 10036]MUG92280.1 PAS domain-containing protein [Scytonema sp. UIC 10036]